MQAEEVATIPASATRSAARPGPVSAGAAGAQLTPTQVKVLRGVHLGLLNKQIASDLGIAEATVKAHMTALMRKLNVRNRTQVAVAAQVMGWTRPVGMVAAG